MRCWNSYRRGKRRFRKFIGFVEVLWVSTSIGFSGAPLGTDIVSVAFTDNKNIEGGFDVDLFRIFLNVSLIICNLFWEPDGNFLLLWGEGDLIFCDGVDVDNERIELWGDLGGDLLRTWGLTWGIDENGVFCLILASLLDGGTLMAANWIFVGLDSGLGGITGVGLGGELGDDVVGSKIFCDKLEKEEGVSCQLMNGSLVAVGQEYDTLCSHSLI